MLNSDSPQPPKFLPLNITIYTILKRHSVMRMSKMGGSNGHTSDVTSEDTGDVKDQDSKRLEFSEDEENLISRMFSLVGERWSLIAGRIPGRTAEEIEKYWTSKGKCSPSRER